MDGGIRKVISCIRRDITTTSTVYEFSVDLQLTVQFNIKMCILELQIW